MRAGGSLSFIEPLLEVCLSDLVDDALRVFVIDGAAIFDELFERVGRRRRCLQKDFHSRQVLESLSDDA